MRVTCGLAASILLGLLADMSSAQMVQIGPYGSVQVNAPFVRVFVGPGGATSVRAPFAAVDAPWPVYGMPHPLLPMEAWNRQNGTHRLQPTPADPTSLDWQALRRMLGRGAERLEMELDRFSTAATWKRYLRPTELRRLVLEGVDAPPDPQTAETLRKALGDYESAKTNDQFRMVSSLEGFRMVHAALGELVLPPLERARRQLADSARALDREVMYLDNGALWASHLRLPNEILLNDSIADPRASSVPVADPVTAPDPEMLTDALARFDAVGRNPAYRAIAQLPAFQTTHKRLIAYVDLHGQQPLEEPLLHGPRLELVPTPSPEID